jgi:hypothetical protein
MSAIVLLLQDYFIAGGYSASRNRISAYWH